MRKIVIILPFPGRVTRSLLLYDLGCVILLLLLLSREAWYVEEEGVVEEDC
jgi:hypothetical protein